MAKAGYSTSTEGAVALAAATAKSILGVKSHANFGLDLRALSVGFDGVSASAVPVLVELLYCTWATNSPGTASTLTTIRQNYGRVIAAGATAGKTWTTEPTVLTMVGDPGEFLLTPNAGLIVIRFPPGEGADCALAEGFVIRCTAPAVVNVRASLAFERC